MKDPLDELSKTLGELTLHDTVAELCQFVELCRESFTVRSWLFARFAAEPDTRAAFRKLLSQPDKIGSRSRLWSPELNRLVLAGAAQDSNQSGGAHGGLSKTQILALVMRYTRTDPIDLKTFLLVRLWNELSEVPKGRVPAALSRVTLGHWRAMIADPSGQLMRDGMRAVRFLAGGSPPALTEVELGSLNAWKVYLLLHILEHPKPRYQVAALKAALPHKYGYVDRRLIRRFCKRHGILRDERPGRRPGAQTLKLSRQPAVSAG